MINLTLKDTVAWMLSKDWKDQLKAEYWQLRLRIYDIVPKLDTEDPEERSRVLWLNSTMMEYLKALEEKAVACGIMDYIMGNSENHLEK